MNNQTIKEHIIEIVCDAGEGAQKSGTSFARSSAKMGNSLWTVEIIPAEIQPPPHTTGSASGIRIRLSSEKVTNGGDLTNCIFAFNEMSLLSRTSTLADDAIVIIDNIWATHSSPEIKAGYKEILDDLRKKGATVYEIPLTVETQKIVDDPRKGKNMFALGFLSYMYTRDMQVVQAEVHKTFEKKSEAILEANRRLLDAGYQYAESLLDFSYTIESQPFSEAMMAVNGNQAIALGAVAAGFELCSMYPITPATSASHYLSDIFESLGGFVHQAEDEIAAIGVAVGAAYAGKPALTITSGPGMALKTEFLGLTVMTEIPLVVVDVQRGGPSTGLPTKIEQSDLLAALYSTPGDAPKVIMAPGSIEECFHIMKTAREIAEEFRMLVIVLTDANLATGVQLFKRPALEPPKPAAMADLSPVEAGSLPFDWDEKTGLSRRLIPGTPGGVGMTSTLNHNRAGLVRHDSESNEFSHRMRSKKLNTLHRVLKTPEVYGPDEGDLLIVGWGSTRGTIEEAVSRAQSDGIRVSSLNLKFISPFPPGLKEIFSRYKKVITVEMNYSDPEDDPGFEGDYKRYGQLALLLRSHTLVDIQSFARVPGRPIMPMEVYAGLKKYLPSAAADNKQTNGVSK